MTKKVATDRIDATDRLSTDDRYIEAVRRIKGAMKVMAVECVKVRPGSPGVSHHILAGQWLVDRPADGVSPIGAALLIGEGEEEIPEVAAADLLMVSLHWVNGFEDGFNMHPTAEYINLPLYLDGFEQGAYLRKELGFKR